MNSETSWRFAGHRIHVDPVWNVLTGRYRSEPIVEEMKLCGWMRSGPGSSRSSEFPQDRQLLSSVLSPSNLEIWRRAVDHQQAHDRRGHNVRGEGARHSRSSRCRFQLDYSAVFLLTCVRIRRRAREDFIRLGACHERGFESLQKPGTSPGSQHPHSARVFLARVDGWVRIEFQIEIQIKIIEIRNDRFIQSGPAICFSATRANDL